MAGDFVGGDFVGDDFAGDLAGIFSSMRRMGAAADRFTGVRGVTFDAAAAVAAGDAAAGLAVFALDFGDAPFVVEVKTKPTLVQFVDCFA